MTNKQTTSSIQEADKQSMFYEYCYGIIEHPQSCFDDIEALNEIANLENPDEEQKAFRLSVAIRMMRTLTPTPFNEVIIAALKDRKDKNGRLTVINEGEYDY